MTTERTIEGDISAAVADAGLILRDTYSKPFWPRADEADPSERHLSFGVAAALRLRGYTTYFEVPFRGGYVDLVAVDWKREWQVAAEFKNLYRGKKQATSMANDVTRLKEWSGLKTHPPVQLRRLVVGSTWHPDIAEDWKASESEVFSKVRQALGRQVEWKQADGAKIPESQFPNQSLLWTAW